MSKRIFHTELSGVPPHVTTSYVVYDGVDSRKRYLTRPQWVKLKRQEIAKMCPRRAGRGKA
jgi:hypothetical protein